MEGSLVCGNCGHEYSIKEGIANFLLPSHLGAFSHLCIWFLMIPRLFYPCFLLGLEWDG